LPKPFRANAAKTPITATRTDKLPIPHHPKSKPNPKPTHKELNNMNKCPVTHLTMNNGAPVADNQNSLTVGPRGPLLAQDLWLNEKLADFVRQILAIKAAAKKNSA